MFYFAVAERYQHGLFVHLHENDVQLVCVKKECPPSCYIKTQQPTATDQSYFEQRTENDVCFFLFELLPEYLVDYFSPSSNRGVHSSSWL